MYKRIMVAIDHASSRQVLEEAQKLAASSQAQLCIVHVIIEADEDEPGAEALLEQARARVDSRLVVETHLLDADALYGTTGIAKTLADTVREWGADLLVLGSSNRRGLEHFVVGSVAEQVLNKVDSSILLVRPHE